MARQTHRAPTHARSRETSRRRFPGVALLLSVACFLGERPATAGLDTLQPTSATVLTPGNLLQKDEDPYLVLDPAAGLYAAFFSDRAAEGDEIYLKRSTDGVTWTDPPIQISWHPTASNFFPSISRDALGFIHLAFWRWIPVGGGGIEYSIIYNRSSSADGMTWDLGAEEIAAAGPGDLLATLVVDQADGTPYVYFASTTRDATGAVDLSFTDTTIRIYMTYRHPDGTWEQPVRLAGINDATSHNTFPCVMQRGDGTFIMAWSRYDGGSSNDQAAILGDLSSGTWVSTSADGIQWDPGTLVSDAAPYRAKSDLLPSLYADHQGVWNVNWLSAGLGVQVHLEAPVGGTYAQAAVRGEISSLGYSARILATPTPDLLWGVWVEGLQPELNLYHRFFEKQFTPFPPEPLENLPPSGPGLLAPGNPSGNDENPVLLRGVDGSLMAAYASDRNGPNDNEIFLLRSTDGSNWPATPVQITDHPVDGNFYPAISQQVNGFVHAAWWRRTVSGPGVEYRIYYNHSVTTDGATWDLAAEEVVADGPGDQLPTMAMGPDGGRPIVYFVSSTRDANGDVDLTFTDTRLRIYATQKLGDGSWAQPVRLAEINDLASHNTYPKVMRRSDGSYVMAWARYDGAASNDWGAVFSEPSADVWVSTSTDGFSWTASVLASDGLAAGATDVYPSLYEDQQGAWFVFWLSADAGASTWLEAPFGSGIAQASPLEGIPELANGAQILATGTPGVYWRVWTEGTPGSQQIQTTYTLSAAAAGEVPTLTVSEAGGGDLTLSWDPSCHAEDEDYEVYEGALGDFTSHGQLACSTAGATAFTISPGSGNTYYLVVPRSDSGEGSYGSRSDGSERLQGISACLPQALASCP